MSPKKQKKNVCSQCQKPLEIFACRGCNKDFCKTHLTEHRQYLHKQMDEITISHDQLQRTIVEQAAQSNSHPLMKKIDEWEQQSIDKIHKAAENTRKELLIVIATYREKVSKDLTQLTQELGEARKEDDYVETDLNEWMKRLKTLNEELNAEQIIGINKKNHITTLISKIFINNISTDYFDQAIGDVQVIENGQVAVHGHSLQYVAVLGRGEYSLGQHQFRFKIEQASGGGGGGGDFIFGIISKTASPDSLPYLYMNQNLSNNTYDNYGCKVIATQNGYIYFINYHCCFKTNDIVELLIDCDQRQIRLTNQQTQETQEFHVNLTTCPFPWQFFVSLVYALTSVRLCQDQISTESRNEF